MPVLSASTFLVAVSAGVETVRPAIGAMNGGRSAGRSCAVAAVVSPASAMDARAAQA